MLRPNDTVVFGFFAPSSDSGGLADDPVVRRGPLMNAVSHRIGLAHGFLIHSESRANHHMFMNDDIADVIRNVFKSFEANENILAAAIVPGLRCVMNRPQRIAVPHRHRPQQRFMLLRMPQDKPLLHVAPEPVNHSSRHFVVLPVEMRAQFIMRNAVIHRNAPQQCVAPPSIRKSAAVTQVDSSEARYVAHHATSSGCPKRWIMLFASTAAVKPGSCSRGAVAPVTTKAGEAVLARMPCSGPARAS